MHMQRPDRQELELSEFGPRADVANDLMVGGGALVENAVGRVSMIGQAQH